MSFKNGEKFKYQGNYYYIHADGSVRGLNDKIVSAVLYNLW